MKKPIEKIRRAISHQIPQSKRMSALRDYHLSEKVYENKRLVIYRGIREDDKLPVLVRLLKPEYPTRQESDLFDMTMK